MSTPIAGVVGRFAPSPSGSLHLGNLRTAMVAWCMARQHDGRFLLRMEDLTTGALSVAENEQIDDLATLGIDFDGDMVRQSERTDRYTNLLEQLIDSGLTYECFCSRREIREAPVAPHGPTDAYPGTCADLLPAKRAEFISQGRVPALRLRANAVEANFVDQFAGPVEGVVDDFVLRRGDGMVAYNFAVVVDDADSGVTQVVRGDDLVDSTPRQIALQQILGFPTPEYTHVPLVLGPDGQRLSKRHGSVGLRDQVDAGATVGEVRAMIARSLGFDPEVRALEPAEVLSGFDLARIPRDPWVLDPDLIKW